ncbi:hypothetical protein [Sinomicrobium weinanense]|uniref:hypothetical protein n=1 Tax=Sinomicrobium weinanense TaxID=2842200 RepID=UPI00165D1A25|nr:hypothetical protein [Sinomicrobium weinanense]MBU3125953.1 hypothetical protein [Sinomicrobium weinanense]
MENCKTQELAQFHNWLKIPENWAILKGHILADHDLNLALLENDMEAAYTRVINHIDQQERKSEK